MGALVEVRHGETLLRCVRRQTVASKAKSQAMTQPTERLLSVCNSLELSSAVANTNWHWQQIAEAADFVIYLTKQLQRASVISDPQFKEVRRRLASIQHAALKRQKL